MELPVTITLGEAAERYKCSVKTLRRRIHEGKVEALMPGRNILVIRESGDKWYLSTGARAMSACRPGKERMKRAGRQSSSA